MNAFLHEDFLYVCIRENVKIPSRLRRLVVGRGRVASRALRTDARKATEGSDRALDEWITGGVLPPGEEGFSPGLSNRVDLVAKRCLDRAFGIIHPRPILNRQSLPGLSIVSSGWCGI